MAHFFSIFEGFPIEEQIKALADEELLDFWEETQYIEKFMEEELRAESDSSTEYERIILNELQLRSCKRLVGR